MGEITERNLKQRVSAAFLVQKWSNSFQNMYDKTANTVIKEMIGFAKISEMKGDRMKKMIISMLDQLNERQLRLVYWFIKGMK